MTNIFLNFDNCGFKKEVLEKEAQKLFGYIEQLKKLENDFSYSRPESFISLPEDKKLLSEVKELVKKKNIASLENIIIIGIGGSNLGTWAVCKALGGKNKKKLLFAETVDSVALLKIIDLIKEVYARKKKVLVVFVSKSGTTIETIANFGVFVDCLKKNDKNWKERIIAITDKDSKLENYAKNQGFDFLLIPKVVAGRYSVFSSVGLFPLTMAGVKIDGLLKGASQAIDKCLKENIDENPALSSAVSIFLNYQAGKDIHNIFIFNSRLKAFAGWYRQLIGESLGKNNKGIMPIVSLGSTDLHSILQLYYAGPQDKFTSFISIKNIKDDLKVPSGFGLNYLAQNLEGKSLNQIMKAIFQGVKISYQKKAMPFLEIELKEDNEETIGELLQTKMFETIFLAKLMGIDAFGQSVIELYKSETRRLLSE